MSSSAPDVARVAVGRRIAEARRGVGLTQADLAERIGVSLRAVDRYEAGTVEPPSEVLELVAEATGVPLSTLASPSSGGAGDSVPDVGARMARSKRARDAASREVPGDGDVTAVRNEPSAPAAEHVHLVERISDAVGESTTSSPSARDPDVISEDEVEQLRRTTEPDPGEGGAMSDTRPAEAAAQSLQSELPAPPLEIRHESLPRKTLGYSPKATAELFDQVAEAYERLWEDRSKVMRRADELQAELDEKPDAMPTDPQLREELKAADVKERGLVLQLKQATTALAESRQESSRLSQRVSELEGKTSQRVVELEAELKRAVERAREATERAARAEERASRAEAQTGPDHEQERLIGEVLVWARQASKEVVDTAKRDADKIREDAERRASELVSETEREVARLASERDRLEALTSEVQEDLAAFLLGALERVNERGDAPAEEPGNGAAEGVGEPEGERAPVDTVESG